MHEYKKHRRLLHILVGMLFLLTAGIASVKIMVFGFSLSSRSSAYHQIDCAISFDPEPGREIIVSLAVPEPPPGYHFEHDSQTSQFHRVANGGSNRLIHRMTSSSAERKSVNCRFRLVPGRTQIHRQEQQPDKPQPILSDHIRDAYREVWNKVDPENNLDAAESIPALLHHLGGLTPAERKAYSGGTVEIAINLLGLRNIPARSVRCISLEEKKLQQQPELLLDVFYDGAWHMFRPSTGLEVSQANLLVLQRCENSMLDITGAKNSLALFSVTQVPAGADRLNRLRAQILDISDFSLFTLPAQEQNRFKWLDLLPLAILLIVLARNVIGIQTMGTFMPVLIAMAFLEMKLLPGIVNFLLILTVGLVIRSWLSRLNLLMVPRISAVVVVVILLMQLISITANFFHLSDFMGITSFPLIIIAWTIERASTTWEEDGVRNTLKQLAASLGAAAVCYLILSNSYLQYLLYAFSELNLTILGIILLLGTYTGYRLTELFRFEPLVKYDS